MPLDKLDYPRMYERMEEIMLSLPGQVAHWSHLNNNRWETKCELMNYPPRIHLTIWLDGRAGKRAKALLPQHFSPFRLGFSNVALPSILDLVTDLKCNHRLNGFGQRTENILLFSLRHKVPSFINADEELVGDKEAMPPKEKT